VINGGGGGVLRLEEGEEEVSPPLIGEESIWKSSSPEGGGNGNGNFDAGSGTPEWKEGGGSSGLRTRGKP
jgi:hypothetical protein